MRQYIGQMSLIALLLLPIYVLLRVWMVRKRGIGTNRPREVVLGLFVVSMAALGALALQPAPGYTYWPGDMLAAATHRVQTGDGLNLLPFDMVKTFFLNFRLEAFFLNIVGNVVMFIPIGLCLPLLYKKWQAAWKVALAGLAVPLFIESVQFFIGRSTDIDDVILNLAGVMMGYGLFLIAKKLFPKWAHLQV